MQLLAQIKEHKVQNQKLVEEKQASDHTWSIRRSEWETLSEKLAMERDTVNTELGNALRCVEGKHFFCNVALY